MVKHLVAQDLLFLIITIYASKMIRGMNTELTLVFFPLYGHCILMQLSNKSVTVISVLGSLSCAVADRLEPEL